ncbi:hypothetical protein BmR1_04g07920 [Babesia microti strain RI]|uniref:Uncharacterized protein n=1 Tax=Babesia microti (strain RI) TaxID=1133968 RepID=A0A1N6LY15_BABMR|nr:hypothetical protein BmR1_04g07920 [Babesia microti strain RI]SIO73776.1 hypothetical protein BmR1_04g07920 [Babesia microti strain RI]|eukprot:XP_021337837.1 hypothetical protein BmR1_04g07920 [Babesia microti strain RI]
MRWRNLLYAPLYVQYFIISTNTSAVYSICTYPLGYSGLCSTKTTSKCRQSIANHIPTTFVPTYFKIKNNYSLQHIGVFNYLRDKLDNFLQGQWFVPPVPTGPKPSEIIAARGSLQTDEETAQLLYDLGLDEDANADEVISAMEHQLSILPEDRHEELRQQVDELLRKKFVELFREFEEKMEQGPEIWRELWDPSKDPDNSLESLVNEKELSDDGRRLIKAALRKKRIDAFLYTLDLGGLIRFTDKKLLNQRLWKVQFLMLPVLAMSIFERLSPTCMALQSMIATKLISECANHDSTPPLDSSTDPAGSVATMGNESPTTARTQRSLSARSMMTSMVVLSTSLIGTVISRIAQQVIKNLLQLPYLNDLAPTVITAFCVNTCLIISSLLVDTSPMNAEQQRLHDLARLEKLPFPSNINGLSEITSSTADTDDSDDLIIHC